MLEKVNKVQNLIWLCNDCYRMVNSDPILPDIDEKVLKRSRNINNSEICKHDMYREGIKY